MKIIGRPRAFRLAWFSLAPALKKTPTAERNDGSASVSTTLKVVSHNIFLKEYLNSAPSRREPPNNFYELFFFIDEYIFQVLLHFLEKLKLTISY